MAYLHDGSRPVTAKRDPIDPDATDWVFFAYDDWLRTGETIIAHSALIEGGVIETASTYLGSMTDQDSGTVYAQTYGVEISVTAGATAVTVTHRVSTSVAGAVNIGRANIDHSIVLPVKTL